MITLAVIAAVIAIIGAFAGSNKMFFGGMAVWVAMLSARFLP